MGGVVEAYGDVSDWKDGAGIRFLIRNNLKLLNAGALAGFKESVPEWMKRPPAVRTEPALRATRTAVPPPAAQGTTGEQAEFMAHYRTIMQHMAQDRTQIAQARRAVATRAPNAAVMQTCLSRKQIDRTSLNSWSQTGSDLR